MNKNACRLDLINDLTLQLNCAIEVTVKPNHWRVVTWYRIGALRFIYLILLSKQVYFLWSINIVSFISASSQVLWCHLDLIYDCSYDIYVMQKFLPWFMVSAKLPTKQAFFFQKCWTCANIPDNPTLLIFFKKIVGRECRNIESNAFGLKGSESSPKFQEKFIGPSKTFVKFYENQPKNGLLI